jgi:hypothetical protein
MDKIILSLKARGSLVVVELVALRRAAPRSAAQQTVEKRPFRSFRPL